MRGGLRGFRIFLACLALGVAAIAAVGLVRASIAAGLEREGAALLGGDVEITYTYRRATDAEREWMEAQSLAVSEVIDFRSLAAVDGPDGTDRALTQIKAVDGAYPLVGEVRLDPPMPLEEALTGTGAVMERSLAARLDLSPDDTFRLGETVFTLSALLERYPDNAGGGFGLGPRTILRQAALEGSGLIADGTLFDSAYRLDLPEGADPAALRAEARRLFEGSGLRWRDARNGGAGIGVFVDRLGAFLVLIGLSGLAVGGVGISSAVGAYLSGKTATIATLRTLGATRGTIFAVYFLQIAALAALGIAIGLVLGAGLPLALAPLIEARLPIPAEFALYPAPLAEAALYGALAALLFALWPLARVEEVRAATLLRDGAAGGRRLPRARYLVATALLAAALVGAAAWFSGTIFLTLWTAGGIAGALVLLVLAAMAIRRIARGSARLARGRPATRLALGAIGARGGETTSVVLSLGLGLSVLAAVGQVDGTLRGAIEGELPEVAPALFVLDIQPGQIDPFRAALSGDPDVTEVDAVPMLRGIITEVNDRPARETADHWVFRGDRGVTYADALREGEVITEGDWWPEDYDGPPLVSFSAAEAEEIGLQLGDTITVNVLGRDITATIASFREVDFQSAGIAFVMIFDPATLAAAPHSWIATIYADEAAEGRILRQLADAYPNITAISVREAVTEVARVVEGIATASRVGAGVTLLVGFIVLIGAALAGERARTFESAVLKTLGASRGRILASFALRAALMGAAAGLVALGAGALGGWAVARFVMEIDYRVIWGNALLVVSFGIAASLLAGLGFALGPLGAKPARVLRGRE
ncbi:ABC transporter permease [Wenxinia saemankumensis]|nr:FtsX-like permease family protein [Wenxinia saemankumensis]